MKEYIETDTTRLLEIRECAFEEIGDDHEPPIGVGGEPFSFDVPNEFQLNNSVPLDDTVPSDLLAGYHTYNFVTQTGVAYTAIHAVNVKTEKRNGWISFNTFFMDEDEQGKLRLWLSATKDESTNPNPDVIIYGAGGGLILSRQRLNARQRIPKSRRSYRHAYPDPTLSVVKWELVDGSGAVKQRDSRDDMYYFYVSFYH